MSGNLDRLADALDDTTIDLVNAIDDPATMAAALMRQCAVIQMLISEVKRLRADVEAQR